MTFAPKKLTAAMLLCTALSGVTSMSHAAPINPTAPVSVIDKWDKTFAQSDKVDHRKVTFQTRYGITLVGDLYIPKDRGDRKLAAIAVSGPFGAVKEQSSGLYAQTLAEHGFVALAFDPSYTGESGGHPRNVASPDINTEDFSAAVDFLGLQKEVDRTRIGLLGICGWGGMALNDAAMDTRVKAVATSVMYDMSRAMGHGVGDGKDRYSTTDRRAVLQYLNNQRWKDAETGSFAPGSHDISVDEKGNVSASDRILPETLPENPNPVLKEFFDYYRMPRGFHERSVNSAGAWNATMPLSFMNMPLLSYANEITIPTLIVTGEKAHSRYFAEDAYKAVGSKQKELVIIPGANHVDLYDNAAGKIPWAKFEQFFKTNLK
ncbi:alpha/beta hydrolase [Salmonella enterica]|uniref:alpha/beta hydrolase n=1 Tax=Salmonella enterica TaxID=28901 RepID=UPI002ACDCA25|nr:alpha/beta hydrolase [Salmonella enterica]WQG06123.1 alpha/beta hydrolase [Salmonella enterica subsp. enterica serovar Abortusovis]WQG10667.1 alpha/beta hydrolase [Salmonella enterica subsp. enterica serovar Abortusovis]WQG15105.1 alpha/beta hydrolase [Salmonella enterica subsp. enterica serovar Abortusovis]HCT0247665.1 alpha/beta hydrolase [Salmonella enterica subsp. enterica serovar Abortusovis]HDN4695051.1 alpha/beta hydrolase [Salmonella enterica subsp. enterica serovar Abortusovis]